MAILRLVPDLAVADPVKSAAFYRAVFALDTAMEMPFIQTLKGDTAPVQLSLASEGGSGQVVPALSIEVDDLDETLARAATQGAAPIYGPVDEPWGVRRAYVRDPDGHILNILVHKQEGMPHEL